jgi:hypothetical protein
MPLPLLLLRLPPLQLLKRPLLLHLPLKLRLLSPRPL